MNVALAHHWLVGMRGGEKVLEQLALLFARPPIYTLFAKPDKLSGLLSEHHLVSSVLNQLPGSADYYKKLMPFFPMAIRRLTIDPNIDFIFSSDASVIKGLSNTRRVPHVCYCHSPPRYLWDMHQTYLENSSGLGPFGKLAFRFFSPGLRKFDSESAKHVDHFIANSRFVQDRIQTCYGRESTVIHPPVALQDFTMSCNSDDFYLIVSELTPYKRIDIAVEAFNRNGKRLVVIGRGSELQKLKRIGGPNIEFLGSQPFSVLKQHYETCRAFIFPGIEDFGITPLEAQAAGKPVIGLAAGGLLETTIENETAIYFHEQTPTAVMAAVERFESERFDPQNCRRQAERFSPEIFRAAIREFLIDKYPTRFKNFNWGAQ